MQLVQTAPHVSILPAWKWTSNKDFRNRGDKTPLELFLSGLSGWSGGLAVLVTPLPE